MSQLDRYFISQLLAPFGFFALVIVGIMWLAQALPLVDQVIESGQSGWVFLEITSLLIPRVMMVSLPFAAFAAALYALNKLYTESELIVMMTAGQSPLALAKPVAMFGGLIMILMVATTFYLVPASQTQLHTRMNEIRTELVGSLIREGQFVHPTENITIYVRESNRDGEMAGLFLHDQSDPDERVTYSAQKALLLQDGSDIRIVMINGIIQQYKTIDKSLNTIRFDRFSFDLGEVLPGVQEYKRVPFEMYPQELLFPSAEMRMDDKWSMGVYAAEGHHKVALPFSALILPLMALSSILLGGFRRGSFTGRIIFVFFIGVFLQSAVIIAKSAVQTAPELAWTIYMPSLAGFVISMGILHQTGRIRKRKPRGST